MERVIIEAEGEEKLTTEEQRILMPAIEQTFRSSGRTMTAFHQGMQFKDIGIRFEIVFQGLKEVMKIEGSAQKRTDILTGYLIRFLSEQARQGNEIVDKIEKDEKGVHSFMEGTIVMVRMKDDSIIYGTVVETFFDGLQGEWRYAIDTGGETVEIIVNDIKEMRGVKVKH